MALIGDIEKAGNLGLPAAGIQLFPPCVSLAIWYGDLAMNQQADRDMFRAVFPALVESEVAEAADNFDAYLAMILRIYDRISADPKTLAELRAALALHRRAIGAGISPAEALTE